MEDVAGIFARELPTLDRHVQLGIAGGKLVHVSFPRTPDDEAGDDHELLDRIAAIFAEGEPDHLEDVEIGLTVPTDQRAVLEALRQVRPGESTDVHGLARMTPTLDDEEDDDLRLVREALSNNPLPLAIPDHRVDGVSGATPGELRSRLREIEGLSP